MRTAAVAAIGVGVVVLADSVLFRGDTTVRIAQADNPHQHEGTAGGSFEVALRTHPERVQAGTPSELVFALSDSSGQPVAGLLTHHGRKLHVVIVSDDMQVLGHIHPEDFGESIEGGVAKAFFTFSNAGRYLVAVDFMTPAQVAQDEQFIVEVGGPPAKFMPEAEARPSTVAVQIETDDRYTEPVSLREVDQSQRYGVSLQQPDSIRADEEASFAFRFSKDGAPMTGLRPYLDAPMHLAVVKDDLTAFLHAHGTLAEDAHAGHGGHESAHGNADSGADTFGPEISARVSFPEPGTYYLFAQAVHGDQLLISRFPVHVDAAAAAKLTIGD